MYTDMPTADTNWMSIFRLPEKLSIYIKICIYRFVSIQYVCISTNSQNILKIFMKLNINKKRITFNR